MGARNGVSLEAWRAAWSVMVGRHDWLSGNELADQISSQYDLKPESVRKLLSAVERAGMIEKRYALVPTPVMRNGSSFPSRRQHVFYRVPADQA